MSLDISNNISSLPRREMQTPLQSPRVCGRPACTPKSLPAIFLESLSLGCQGVASCLHDAQSDCTQPRSPSCHLAARCLCPLPVCLHHQRFWVVCVLAGWLMSRRARAPLQKRRAGQDVPGRECMGKKGPPSTASSSSPSSHSSMARLENGPPCSCEQGPLT